MVDLDKLVELARQAVLAKATVDSAEERMGDEFDDELLDQLIEDSDDATDAFQAAATPEVVISLIEKIKGQATEARCADVNRIREGVEQVARSPVGAENGVRDAAERVCEAMLARENAIPGTPTHTHAVLDVEKTFASWRDALNAWRATRETQA